METKFEKRKTGEHLMADFDGIPKCVTCEADEDDVFVGNEKCSYVVPPQIPQNEIPLHP